MNWRDVIIGSVSTLVVTILGGIGVYYFTKEKPIEKAERLFYSIENSGQFTGNEKSVGVVSVQLENFGELAASKVTSRLWLDADLISDHKVTITGGDDSRIKITQASPKELSFTVDHLFPHEGIKIVMLTSSSDVKPKFTSHSDSSIAKERAALDNAEEAPPHWLSWSSILLIAASAVPASIFANWVTNKIFKKWLSRHLGRASSLNNIAFSILHSGDIKEAHKLLLSAIGQGLDAPHSLSNYGLVCGLLGDDESSVKWLKAAEFYATTAHEKAMVSLNRGILFALSGSNTQAVELFEQAANLSTDEMQQYAKYSVIIAPLIEANEQLRTALLGPKRSKALHGKLSLN